MAATDSSGSVNPPLRDPLGGAAYTEWGVAAVSVGATVAVLARALAILFAPRRPAREALEAAAR